MNEATIERTPLRTRKSSLACVPCTVCVYVFRSDEVSKQRNGQRLGGLSLVKDRLTISEVVEVLRDPSMITDPPQRPKAVPNLHISRLFLFQETNDPNAGLAEARAPSSGTVHLFCKLPFHPATNIIF